MGIINLLTDRWLSITLIFIAPLVTIYLIFLSNLSKNKFIKCLFMSLFIILFVFINVTSPIINKDNSLFSDNTVIRDQFKLNEIQAIKTLNPIYNKKLIVDSSYYDCLIIYSNYSDYNIILYNTEILNGNINKYKNDVLLFRKDLLKESAVIVYNETFITSPIPNSVYNIFKIQNICYSNGETEVILLR